MLYSGTVAGAREGALHGALGMLSGAIERELRNALPSSVFSGGSEVLKNQLVQQLRGDYKREARGGR